eukprot:3940614-Rhodomonas_salina.1
MPVRHIRHHTRAQYRTPPPYAMPALYTPRQCTIRSVSTGHGVGSSEERLTACTAWAKATAPLKSAHVKDLRRISAPVARQSSTSQSDAPLRSQRFFWCEIKGAARVRRTEFVPGMLLFFLAFCV